MDDARSIVLRDPAAKSVLEVLLLYPGYHALFFYRMAHQLYNLKLYFLARWISQIVRFATGIEIHPGAVIGKRLFIDHGMGVVIGETAIIGDDCTIYHGVTLGGTGKNHGKRHPTVGNNVMISSGSKVLGPIFVGDNARIGANAVVLHDVKPSSTVVGVPGKSISKKKNEGVSSYELDQVEIPDPMAFELSKMKLRLEKLEKELFQDQDKRKKRNSSKQYQVLNDYEMVEDNYQI